MAAEADLHRLVVLGDQPALRRAAPVVGALGLLAVFKLLAEHAQLIADGIARGLQAQGGHAVHIAGGKTAQTAVAQARVRLALENVGGVVAHILQRAGHGLGNAQVEGVFHQAAAHEKLHGHVVDLFFRAGGVLRCQKAAHDLADNDSGSLENLIIGSVLSGDAEMSAQLVFNGAAHFVA